MDRIEPDLNRVLTGPANSESRRSGPHSPDTALISHASAVAQIIQMKRMAQLLPPYPEDELDFLIAAWLPVVAHIPAERLLDCYRFAVAQRSDADAPFGAFNLAHAWRSMQEGEKPAPAHRLARSSGLLAPQPQTREELEQAWRDIREFTQLGRAILNGRAQVVSNHIGEVKK